MIDFTTRCGPWTLRVARSVLAAEPRALLRMGGRDLAQPRAPPTALTAGLFPPH